jgi:hypothetical protein
MTLTALITLNAVLGAGFFGGLAWHLANGIQSHRRAQLAAVRPLPQNDAERLAA